MILFLCNSLTTVGQLSTPLHKTFAFCGRVAMKHSRLTVMGFIIKYLLAIEICIRHEVLRGYENPQKFHGMYKVKR